MFDRLLEFVETKQTELLAHLIFELQTKPDVIMVISDENRKAIVSTYSRSELPYPQESIPDLKDDAEMDAWETPKVAMNANAPNIWTVGIDDGDKALFMLGERQTSGDKMWYVMRFRKSDNYQSANGWKLDTTTVGYQYTQVCRAAGMLPLQYMVFRSNADFCAVVPNGTPEEGEQILQWLQAQRSPLLNQMMEFKRNDTVGSPLVFRQAKGNIISTNTLRYICHAHIICDVFGRQKHEDVGEIGGSYGGMCFVLSRVMNWSNYVFMETAECKRLCNIVMADLEVKNVIFNSSENLNLLITLRTLDDLTDSGWETYRDTFAKTKSVYASVRPSEADRVVLRLEGLGFRCERMGTVMTDEVVLLGRRV